MIPRIESTLGQTTLEIQPDSDGEERVLQAEAVLELDICLYQEETVSLLQDVYHPHRECIPKVQEETLESLLIRNSSKCRLTDKLQMRVPKNKILQICHSDGKIKIDEERNVENGIEVTGVVELRRSTWSVTTKCRSTPPKPPSLSATPSSPGNRTGLPLRTPVLH